LRLVHRCRRYAAGQSGELVEKLLVVPDYAVDPRFSPAEQAALAYDEAATRPARGSRTRTLLSRGATTRSRR
jgi:alkylhydroperoxidase family enzyme